MKKNVLLFFLAAMAAVVRATSQPPNPIPLPYDHYSVVFQWAKSVCNTGRRQYTKPIPPAFTLCGLWPQSPNEDSWRREYEKSGSCVEPFYLDQLKYFVTAHRVATSTDLYSILQAAGIRYGCLTTVQDFRTAIHASTGFWPTVQCNWNIAKTPQLFQIHLCFNKTTNGRMDCPIIHKGCIDPHYPIYYPPPCENKYLPPKRCFYHPPAPKVYRPPPRTPPRRLLP